MFSVPGLVVGCLLACLLAWLVGWLEKQVFAAKKKQRDCAVRTISACWFVCCLLGSCSCWLFGLAVAVVVVVVGWLVKRFCRRGFTFKSDFVAGAGGWFVACAVHVLVGCLSTWLTKNVPLSIVAKIFATRVDNCRHPKKTPPEKQNAVFHTWGRMVHVSSTPGSRILS